MIIVGTNCPYESIRSRHGGTDHVSGEVCYKVSHYRVDYNINDK